MELQSIRLMRIEHSRAGVLCQSIKSVKKTGRNFNLYNKSLDNGFLSWLEGKNQKSLVREGQSPLCQDPT
jgi:hypothetical protein